MMNRSNVFVSVKGNFGLSYLPKSFKVQPLQNTMPVANYVTADDGTIVLSPIPSCKSHSIPRDCKSLEIANLLLVNSLPDTLVQVDMEDQMSRAEALTTYAVRRFGDLEKQMSKLKSKEEDIPNV